MLREFCSLCDGDSSRQRQPPQLRLRVETQKNIFLS